MKMKISKLDAFFFKIEDKMVRNNNNKFSLEVQLLPKYGKIGFFVWYFLRKIIK